MNASLIFIVGQTAVGKSTTLEALQASAESFTLLPNRRQLTDDIIIPEIQQDLGQPQQQVKDRVERFALTKSYREKYGSGMIHALERYFASLNSSPSGTVVFDNIRGLTEVKAAHEAFKDARFVFLFAPPFVRLQRMLARQDAFDKAGAARLENSSFIENLQTIEGVEEVFDLYELARLEASGASDEALINSATIITAEVKNYNAEAAKAYLDESVSGDAFLFLNTSDLNITQVRDAIKAWL